MCFTGLAPQKSCCETSAEIGPADRAGPHLPTTEGVASENKGRHKPEGLKPKRSEPQQEYFGSRMKSLVLVVWGMFMGLCW